MEETIKECLGGLDYQYITFKLMRETERTGIWGIFNKKADIAIGTVKWYPHWRQYCFFPEPDMVFSVGCMYDIVDFIRKLKKARDYKKTKGKQMKTGSL